MHAQHSGDPSYWHPDDLARDGHWRMAWTASEVAEIGRMASRYAAHPWPWAETGPGAFEAPALSARMDRAAQIIANGCGVTVIGGFPVDAFDEDATRAIVLWLGFQIGEPKGQNADGNVISSVTDTGMDYRANVIARGYLTNAELQPHTDGGDITGLLCMRAAKSGGETLIGNSLAIRAAIRAERPDLLPVYEEGFRYFVRDADGRSGFMLPGRIPVYFAHQGVVSSFLVPRSYEAAAVATNEPLAVHEVEALDYIQRLFYQPRHSLRLSLKPGDLLLFDNWTHFHARTEFSDFEQPERKRLLYRLWVHARLERPVPDLMAMLMRPGVRKRPA